MVAALELIYVRRNILLQFHESETYIFNDRIVLHYYLVHFLYLFVCIFFAAFFVSFFFCCVWLLMCNIMKTKQFNDLF